MSGRAPQPLPSDRQPEPPGSPRAKARILLPIALSVAALVVFLVAFWPDTQGKKSHSRRGHGSERGGSPIGGSDRGDLEDLGNASVTRGGSPIGGGNPPSQSNAGSDGWWYQDKAKPSKGKGEQWWYQDGKGSSKNEARERSNEAKAPGKSGPDENWWHD